MSVEVTEISRRKGSQVGRPVMDLQIALCRVGGDVDLLKEIAEIFLDDYPKTLSVLETAVAGGDLETLERSAHGLKGAVANFGAQDAFEAAQKLESLGHAKQLNGVSEALTSLVSSLSTLRVELKAL